MTQHVTSTILSNLMAIAKVSDMFRLAIEAFYCLKVFNLDHQKVYDQVSGLLYLQRKLLAVEGALEKLLPSGSASLELQEIVEWLDLFAKHILPSLLMSRGVLTA